jgi:hypothetical protein
MIFIALLVGFVLNYKLSTDNYPRSQPSRLVVIFLNKSQEINLITKSKI